MMNNEKLENYFCLLLSLQKVSSEIGRYFEEFLYCFEISPFGEIFFYDNNFYVSMGSFASHTNRNYLKIGDVNELIWFLKKLDSLKIDFTPTSGSLKIFECETDVEKRGYKKGKVYIPKKTDFKFVWEFIKEYEYQFDLNNRLKALPKYTFCRIDTGTEVDSSRIKKEKNRLTSLK